ncbi:neutral alpha-glucosidase C [Chanos chanos]|uniref:Neutral alpha-glucosidase C n=1 Tax=Chanos chanos TaxID=29144 RepID=A0A6J2WG66_CHACN|nr:neutral alpha-glucosidase C [Chanos chanos]
MDSDRKMCTVLDGEEGKKYSELPRFYRQQKDGPSSQYCASLESLVLTEKGAGIELSEPHSQVRLLLQVQAIQNKTVRVSVNELQPLKARYKVEDVLDGEPICEQLRVQRKSKDFVILTWGLGQHQVQVFSSPFRLDVICEDEVTVTLNPRGRLHFEGLPRSSSGLYQHKGSLKKRIRQQNIPTSGSSSVGLDLRLHGYSDVYGLPEHADSFRLKDTSDTTPYRLYNLDVYAYPINSRRGLYGSVPLLLAHKLNRTVGVFWLNASETLVDLQFSPKSKEVNSAGDGTPEADVNWVSESGVIDCFILLGPTPAKAFCQYAELTGYQALPSLFSLGYHQCRWNYNDEADVKEVDAGFDKHNIPYDVIWLDIEHTKGKRYFTWDPKCFPNPVDMQEHLQRKNRKLVVISDPHIKVDPDWPFFCEARDSGYFIKNNKHDLYKGSCWPGSSCYLDFSYSQTRSWYARCFALDKYEGSTESLFVWIDMNEPSDFSGPEKTLPKDTVHHEGWEHRDLHNLYGFYQHMATAAGLVTRSGGLERPFVLSRSFFAGSQRFGAIWTGDNVATWEYLKISISMLLSLSVSGIHFCGADVGGFVQDPKPELLVRWYQAGALQPFFRGHSSRTSKRREPWLFGEDVTSAVRSVIQQRYCLLPYWYTLFYQAHTSGQPPMRPLWVEFPLEKSIFRVENSYMIGSALLVAPVTDPGVKEVTVLLPGPDELWYDVCTSEVYKGGRSLSVPVTLDTVPMFQRGGTVVFRRAGCGSSTADLQQYPFILTVALDNKGSAEGLLYLDDGHSFSYRDQKQFSLFNYTMRAGCLVSSCSDEQGIFVSAEKVDTVIILGVNMKPSNVTVLKSGGQEDTCGYQYDEMKKRLTIHDLNLEVHTDWEIKIE